MKTSTITIRLPLETLHEIDRLSKLTKLRPSVFCAYIIQDKMKEWVNEYAENIAKELEK
ncbi:MAG: hypothetical protein ACTSSO_07845 [Candidatus Hodarchaeales archaeon]